MFVRPTPHELIDAVRRELKTVAAAPDAADVPATFGMIDSILRSVALRSEHEAEWIAEEIAAIEQGAEYLIAEGADGAGTVSTALDALRARRSDAVGLTALRADYNLAGEILSCALEAAMIHGGAVREKIEALLAARMKREVEIRGPFSLEGRT